MLKKLKLINYRCFERTEISFKQLSIVVGKNNAGKSTLIEALRILSVVVSRCRTSLYQKPPQWLKLQEQVLGISPLITNLEINPAGLFYMYGEGPAQIIADFDSGANVTIYVGDELELFAVLTNGHGITVESKKFGSSLNLRDVNILPQISPLLKDEPIIKYETVQRNLATYLSSRNFRNQLHYYPREFEQFKSLAERTWKGLQIHSDTSTIRTQGSLFLFVRDNKFEAEIGTMGHGLQMWLQTMWFLSRSSFTSAVILDEPDVYMHADLQRRLIKLIKDRYSQVIVATHSVEIMSDVEPENILPIDNTKARQDYANKTPLVQRIVNDIGSVFNIEITRLFSSNKFLIVEGEKDDVKLLSIFQSKVFPDSFEQLDTLPKIFVRGWSGWQRVIGSNSVFTENKTSMMTYCIFDSDYHTDEEKDARRTNAVSNKLNLHIWSKKEIENYLLIPAAFVRLVKNRRKAIACNEAEIGVIIDEICDNLKDDVIDCFATELRKSNPSKEIRTVNKEARAYVGARWETNRRSLVSGKEVLALLFQKISEQYKVSISKFAVAREITLSETDPELIKVLSCIENRTSF